MVRFDVVMTAPRLAPRAQALLKAAGCAVHFMDSDPSEAAVAVQVDRLRVSAVRSRQGRVGEAAMGASLRLRIVADVTTQEPPEPGSRLRTHPRVILTPHVAGVTPSALGCMAAECIVAALTGAAIPPARIVTLPERG